MGLDMSYQALPEPCTLMERALVDQEFGELLSFLPDLYAGRSDLFRWQDGKRSGFRRQAQIWQTSTRS